MKLAELLIEGYTEELVTDLDNVLVQARARGMTTIDTQIIVNQMLKMGYDVSANSLITVLNDSPMIQVATPDTIELAPQEVGNEFGADTEMDQEDSQEVVSKMAKDQVNKDLNER